MMKIRKILESHFEINNAINAKLEQLAELKSLAAKVTVSPFAPSHSEGTYTDRVGRTTARIIDLENEINAEIEALVELKGRIKLFISAIPDRTQQTVLERHYILNQSWDSISDEIGYSTRHLNRIHNQALEWLEREFGESIA